MHAYIHVNKNTYKHTYMKFTYVMYIPSKIYNLVNFNIDVSMFQDNWHSTFWVTHRDAFFNFCCLPRLSCTWQILMAVRITLYSGQAQFLMGVMWCKAPKFLNATQKLRRGVQLQHRHYLKSIPQYYGTLFWIRSAYSVLTFCTINFLDWFPSKDTLYLLLFSYWLRQD